MKPDVIWRPPSKWRVKDISGETPAETKSATPIKTRRSVTPVKVVTARPTDVLGVTAGTSAITGNGKSAGRPKAKFDRNAYQREYMRGWRKKQKTKP